MLSTAASITHGEDHCLRDVVALSTLPAVWWGAEPLRIAESLAAALFTTLNPEFVCVCFNEGNGKPPICVAQTDRHHTNRALAEQLSPAILEWAQTHDPEEYLDMLNPLGPGTLRVAARAIGFHAELGVIAAGFIDEGSPSPVHHILLNVGATQATSAIQNARLLNSLRETVAEREKAVQALSESERRVRELLESSPDCIQVLDFEGRLVSINAVGVKLLELDDKATLIGKRWIEVWEGEGRVSAERALASAIKGEKVCFQGFTTTAKGTNKWWDVILSPVFVADGTSRQIMAVARDVSARKRTEGALAEITAASEKRSRLYDTVLSSTPDLVYVFDLNHRFTYANEALLKMWGRSWDESIGKNCLELGYEPWHAALHDREIEQVIATKAPIRGEVPFTGANGRHIYDYIFVPVIGLNGEVEAVAGTTRNVTERKRVEMNSAFLASISQELARLNSVNELMELVGARLGEFFKLSLCAFMEIDETGGRVNITHNWHREDVPGVAGSYDLREYLSEDFQKAGRAGEVFVVRNITTDPRTDTGKYEAMKIGAFVSVPLIRDREWRFLLCIYHSTPYDWRDDEIELIRELTTRIWTRLERVRVEEHLEQTVAERTAKLKDIIGELEAFSYSISHDMRAPLRSMQGFANLLATEYGAQVDEVGKDYIRRIITSASRMDHLIQDVLTYSKVTRADCQLEPVNLEILLRGILESYSHLQMPHACIQVEGRLPTVIGNEAVLTQCFSNLLGNAVKFVSPGTLPHVRVWAEPRGPWVRVSIQDNGIGIEPEFQEKIFGIFQRLSKDFEGTGIGLAIVKKAVDRMNSRVGLDSEVGKGSTFWLELKDATVT